MVYVSAENPLVDHPARWIGYRNHLSARTWTAFIVSIMRSSL